MSNELYFGDNLDVMREKIKDDSVDLLYLDPPFKSNANYNVLFKESYQIPSEAQAEAFRDTWAWGESAARAYDDVIASQGDVALILRALRSWMGQNSTMAYLSMMAVRLQEMKRILKKTGCIYLHCDPSASHYLKILIDAIFGPSNFRNEIIWKRTPFAGSSKSRARQLPRSHDVILFFNNSEQWFWEPPTAPYSPKYLERFKWDDNDGRGLYRKTLLKTYSDATFLRLQQEGKLIYPIRKGAKYSYKQYLEGSKRKVQIDDLWTDINALNPVARERLGYPTQKPLALLERILLQSSREDHVVFDPFCGCGTTVDAAERLRRRWIGIDITHFAVTLIEKRIKTNNPEVRYGVYGRPTTMAGATDLARRDKHQFQWWAAWLLGAQTYESKKGGDRGIDGNIYFANGPYGHGRLIISVKGGEHVNPAMVRELYGTVSREEAEMGVLVTLVEPTKGMIADAAACGFVKRSAHGRLPSMQIVTIRELLAGKLPKLPALPPVERIRQAKTTQKNKDQFEFFLPFVGEGASQPDARVSLDGDVIVDPRLMTFA